MGHAQDFVQKAAKTFEKQKHTFHLPEDTLGASFTHRHEVTIPAGRYSVVETDSRSESHVIIINLGTYEMYSLPKKKVPQD